MEVQRQLAEQPLGRVQVEKRRAAAQEQGYARATHERLHKNFRYILKLFIR